MEIQIQRIDPWVTEEDLYKEIASALHNPPVRLPGQGLTNFRLLLPKTKRGTHRGYAFLTIAETSTASSFLELCSTERKRRPLLIVRDGRANALKLIPNGFGKESIVRDLYNFPYETWEERQARLHGPPRRHRHGDSSNSPSDEEEYEYEYALSARHVPTPPEIAHTNTYVRTRAVRPQPRKRIEPARILGAWSIVQFGVICEDGSFSIEDFDSPSHPLPSGFDIKSQTLAFGDKDNSIRILFNNIVSWSIDHAHNALAFELEDPATFIRQGRNSCVFDFINHLDREEHIRLRTRYRIRLIGCHFRVCFVSTSDLDWFCLEARPFLKRAGKPRESPRPIVRRNLTDPKFFEAAGQFCANLDLRVAYQLDKLIRNGLYSPTVLNILKTNTHRLINTYGIEFAARVFESLAATSRQVQVRDRNTKCLLGSAKLQERIEAEERRLKRQDAEQADLLETQANSAATAHVYHVTITPTRVLLDGPFMDASNRVLRLFPDFGTHFVRVAFCDEDGDRFPVSRHDLDGIDSESFVRERIGEPLKHGILIAGRKFEALAWSGSGLGSHHCWFVTAFTDKDGRLWEAESIRQSLGNFHGIDRYPARLGARLSQAFSATSSSITINDDWVKILDDDLSHAQMPSNGNERKFYLLTDGVGEISRSLLEEIWRGLCETRGMRREWRLSEQDPRRIPSAIQFRCGGAKGVLCLNPKLTGKKMTIRKSMIKFSAPKHREFEVAATSFSPLPARLNRPLINALEDLGVDATVFLSLQAKAVESAQLARKSFKRASQLVGSFAMSDTAEIDKLFRRLDSVVDIQPDKLSHDGILNRLCTIVIAAALGDLKRKARIPVAGCTLIGVVDEFNFLERGQIFAQVNDTRESKDFRIVEGKVMVGRSPTIHPGDVRVVNAVVPPPGHPLLQLRNVIVFSKSPVGRPLQSILSGGDLDGDIYTIYEDSNLFPKHTESPGQYKVVPPRSLARPCTFEDLADFFVDYVINDQVGLVSTFHLQIADSSPLHSLDPDCIKLAQLHAKAVDYRKTGQAVHRRDVPMPPFNTPRPDFLAQRPAGPGIYSSTRALGRLFRAIPEQSTDTPFGNQPAWSRGETNQSALCGILKQPGKSDDILLILSTLAQKFPQIMPQGLRLVQLQEKFRPLLASFVYHLSRLAAWIPESRAEAEWLSEEEILVGTQVMAIKAKQLKRRQERLTASTAELFPILRSQLQLIAGDNNVVTSTIRPAEDDLPGGPRPDGIGQSDGTVHFTGYVEVVRSPPRPRIVVVDGERVVLREGRRGQHQPSPWSDNEEEYELNQRRGRMRTNASSRTPPNEASTSRSNGAVVGSGSGNGNGKGKGKGKAKGNGNDDVNGSGKGKGKANGNSNGNGNGNGNQKGGRNGNSGQKGKNRAIATTEPELYSMLYNTDEDSDDLIWEDDIAGIPMAALQGDSKARKDRRLELLHLYAACYLGATEVSARHFGGNTFAIIALSCLLERLEEHEMHGRVF